MTTAMDRRAFIEASVAGAGLTPALPQETGRVSNGPSHSASIRDFGAVGDGRADDSIAFERALATLPAGARLFIEGGKRYRLTRSLVLQKPLTIEGGTSDSTEILFDAGAYAAIGGKTAGIIIPHDRTMPLRGDARRTTMSGITFRNIAERRGPRHGLLVTTPAYLYQVNAVGFHGDGFRVEASTAKIAGNANGSSFINCTSRSNGGAGFAFAGDDANSCVLVGARAFENGGHGFQDASLIGNVYLAAEAADNRGAGFWSAPSGPNASIFIGCFAEIGQGYQLNPRNLVLGPQGDLNGGSPTWLAASPAGGLATGREGIAIGGRGATDEDTQGSFADCRLTLDGLHLQAGSKESFRIARLLSANYVDFLSDETPVIRFPNRDVDRNVVKDRPWFPNGLSFGSAGGAALAGSGLRPPTQWTFDRGAIWMNEAPAQGGYLGWTCVKSGTPGTWRPFGAIA